MAWPLLLLLVLAAAPPLLLLLALLFLTAPRRVHVPIRGRHVFVTGGSSGIGLAIARQAAVEGARRVSILARDRARLESAREEIRRAAKGVEVEVYSADVRDEGAVRNALEAAGCVDVLVCNQGVFIPKELDLQDMDEIKFTLDINLLGNFHLIKAALPAMRRRDGSPRAICLISSQAGQVGIYGYTAYCASKFALRGLGEALQMEVITDDIHVSIVYPPDTDTPGLEEELKTRPELTDVLSKSSGRLTAEEVAKKTLGGIRSGTFHVACNLEGVMLAMGSSGLSPQRSPLMAFLEIATAGLMRLVSLSIVSGWYGVIEKHSGKQKKI